jgi:hypothetical protein
MSSGSFPRMKIFPHFDHSCGQTLINPELLTAYEPAMLQCPAQAPLAHSQPIATSGEWQPIMAMSSLTKPMQKYLITTGISEGCFYG